MAKRKSVTKKSKPSFSPPAELLCRLSRLIISIQGIESTSEGMATRREEEMKHRTAMVNHLRSRDNLGSDKAAFTIGSAEFQSLITPNPFASTELDLVTLFVTMAKEDCDHALQATNEGGATRLDETLSPGTQKQSVRLIGRLNKVKHALIMCSLQAGLGNMRGMANEFRVHLKSLNRFYGDLSGAHSLKQRALPPSGGPVLRQPVPLRPAAAIIGLRPDGLAAKLTRRTYPILGLKRARVAELEHVVRCATKNVKALREWADRDFPPISHA